MEGGEGMVAVVRGLRDSGLAVTLLDGNKEYTLMPNSMLHNTSPAPTRDVPSFHVSRQRSTQHNSVSTEPAKDYNIRNTGAQVTDGRYASIYKMSHCHVKPSSPPLELTEFPPQRAALRPGHGNFEVGGAGSGETYNPVKANGKFRGGMSWPDKGSVCSPRPSPETDAFANSLRKYPCISPDRSTEIVERLINYTQSRASKTYSIKNQTSPQRSAESHSSHNLRFSRISSPKSPQRYDPAKDRPRVEEFPTRDRAKKAEGDAPETRKTYYRSYDVKYFKDLPRKMKDNIKIVSSYPYKQPVSPPIKEAYDDLPPRPRRFIEQYSNNMVNTKIQADVRMVSREVATVPIDLRPDPSRRTVAVQLSPTSSNADRTEGDTNLIDNSKSTQKPLILRRKSVQTFSFTDLISSSSDINLINSRRSKSQEELRTSNDYFRKKVLAVFENVACDDRTKEKLKDECLRRLLNSGGTERSPATYNRCVDNMPLTLPQNCREFNDELIDNDRARNMNVYDNITQVYRAEVTPSNVNESIDFAIKNWVDGLPINSRDLGGESDKRHILNNMALKLKELIVIRFRNEIANLKTDILEIIEEVPIDTNVTRNRSTYLNKSIDVLLERIRTTFVYQHNDCDNRNTHVKTPVTNKTEQTHPTKEYLKDFIREQLWDYFHESNMNITDNQIRDIENELTDIFANAIDKGNHRDVKHQMKYILKEIGNLTDDKSKYLTNRIIEKFVQITTTNSYSQVFTVLQNTSQNSNSMTNTDFTIGSITERDLNANLDIYMNQLCIQIDDWLTNLNVSQIQDRGFRQVVVHDLAGDIIDRHKYLELNSSSKGTDQEEMEQLKYQIFKWINKLVGEDNTETIKHAEELMTRIRTIPVPMLKIPPNAQKDVSLNQEQANTCPSPQSQTSNSNKYNPNQTLASNTGRRISGSGEINFTPNMGQKSMSPSVGRPTTSSGPASSYADPNPMFNIQGSEIMAESKNGIREKSSSPVTRDPPKLGNKQPYEPQEVKSKPNSTQERMTRSMPSSPQINRNIRDNIMSSVGSGAMTRGTNDSLPASSTNPVMTVTGKKVFPNKSPTGPSAIPPAPNEMHNNVNQRLPVEQNTNAATPQIGNRSRNEVSQPTTSRNLSCCLTKEPTTPSIKQINEEFDDFLKRWVQLIPIEVSKPEDSAATEKIRLGLYNGIWKAITKLKFEPSIFHNRFYYQDMLDDEIEDLLNILPKTPELETKKHLLKAKLIEKTTDTNEQIMSIAASASYKQQLIDNVENSLPVLDKTEGNLVKLQEELKKNCLAEEYILHIRYKDDDPVKANVYRKKLLKNVKTLIDNIEQNHGQELKNIDPAIYINEVVSALNKVPIPSENTIREEADEILLGIEIEQWYSDLPLLVENTDDIVQLQRRRLRDALTKKIHDLQTQGNQSDYVPCKELRQNIIKFLEKVPLKVGTDINFVTEELVNRLQNRPRDGVRRKSVAFQEPQDFNEFQSNMQPCTTMRTGRNEDPNSILQRSVGVQEPQDYEEFSRNMPLSSSLNSQPHFEEDWLSLDETRLPPCMAQNGRQSQLFDNKIPQTYTNTPQANQKSPRASIRKPTGQNSSNCHQNCNQGNLSGPPIPNNIQEIASGGGYGVPGTNQINASHDIPQTYTNMPQANQNSPRPGFRQPTGQNSSNNAQNSNQGNLSGIPISNNIQEIASGGEYGVPGTNQIIASHEIPQTYTNMPQVNQNSPRPGFRQPTGQNSSNYHQNSNQGNLSGLPMPNNIQENESGGGFEVPGTSQIASRSGLHSRTAPAQFYRSIDRDGIQEIIQNRSFQPQINSSNHTSPGTEGTGQPNGFFTPNQPYRGPIPERPRRNHQPVQRPAGDVRRRLDMDDAESETEGETCRCLEQFRRRRRRPMMFPCDEYDMKCPQFIPMRWPYAYFF